MYPPLAYKGAPTPNLSVYEALDLDGDEYETLKQELSQPVEQAVYAVSESMYVSTWQRNIFRPSV